MRPALLVRTGKAGPLTTRYATPGELAGLLAEDDLDLDQVRAAVDRLADLGVDVGQLVTITVVATAIGREHDT